LHERFIVLFAENATIAAIARVDLEPQRFEHHGNPESVGIDETLQRRYGRKISARGVYREIRCAPPTKPS